MKTLLQTTVLIAIITLVFTANTFASEFNFNEEAYIDDIPFDTEIIFDQLMNPEFSFEDEAYVDDIPFNTFYFAANTKYEKAVSVLFEMDEEAYIDDIPFCTYAIANSYNDKETTGLFASTK